MAERAPLLAVRMDAPESLGDQIVQGLRGALARGALRAGDELPPVRQLAADLGLKLNTVARAHRQLEAQGLVRVQRGRVTRVLAREERRAESDRARRDRVTATLGAALVDARLAGLDRRAVEGLVGAEIDRLWPVPDGVGR